MKKLLAILLSMLMLCAMIPFAAVSAEGVPTIAIVTEEDTYNAGDEIEVTVNLENLDDTPGLIGAKVEIDYDHNVFELPATFDEDEEMWIPNIEVGSKYNASSNKYITFGPIDEETGISQNCAVLYARGTATASQVRKEAHFYTATFRVKADAPSGTYTLTVKNYYDTDYVAYGNVAVPMAIESATITINGTDPEPEEPACEHEYFTPCEQHCMICGELTNPDAAHNVIHVDAVTPTCTEAGNIEYWYCDVCGAAWLDAECTMNTNLRAVNLPMAEHEYLYACDKYCNECGEKTNPRAKHSIIHVDAKPAVSCIEFGNIEYWYCEHCTSVWSDADCQFLTNMKSVSTAGPCISNAEHPCQDGDCINCGLPYAADVAHEYAYDCDKNCSICGEETRPEADHSYSDDLDVDCDFCGDIRVVKYVVKTFGGNSIAESNDGLSGLAFRYDLTDKIQGLTVVDGTKYVADYSNATVTPDSTGTYKLVQMGAKVSNGQQTKDVPVKKIVLDGESIYYAIRITNIPAEQYDTIISCTPYFVYENAEGEQITVYGETNEACASAYMG